MTDKSQTQENNASAINDMAKEYISMWQKQWVATMTDPKTQETLKELYQTMAVMYDKNKEVLYECTEALKRKNDMMEKQYNESKRAPNAAQKDTAQNEPANQPGGQQQDGTAAVYATLDQCVGLLGQLSERLTSIEGRLDTLEQSTSKPTRRKTAK